MRVETPQRQRSLAELNDDELEVYVQLQGVKTLSPEERAHIADRLNLRLKRAQNAIDDFKAHEKFGM